MARDHDNAHKDFRPLGRHCDGKEEKPDDEAVAAAWKVKDLKATGFLLNALSMKLRIKLEDEGFDLDKMTSKQLLALIQTTVLRVSQLGMFNIISDFTRSNRQSFASLDAYVMGRLQNWTMIKANYPDAPDIFFIVSALSGLKESNETWYENWTACLRWGEEIDKDKLVKFLMAQANKEACSQRNTGSLCWRIGMRTRVV